MKIIQTSYEVVSAQGTTLITMSQIKGLRLKKKVLVSAKKK